MFDRVKPERALIVPFAPAMQFQIGRPAAFNGILLQVVTEERRRCVGKLNVGKNEWMHPERAYVSQRLFEFLWSTQDAGWAGTADIRDRFRPYPSREFQMS